MVGKLALGKKLYRYSLDDWRDGGRLATDFRSGFLNPVGDYTGDHVASETGKKILEQAVAYCAERNIKICYSLPWQFTKPEAEKFNRQYNEKFLKDLSEIIPILESERLGVCTEPSYFADTTQHLTDEGAALRSLEIAKGLQKWLSELPQR